MTNADKPIKIGDRVQVKNYYNGQGVVTEIQYKIKFDSEEYRETYYKKNEIELLEETLSSVEKKELTYEQLKEIIGKISNYFIEVVKFDKKLVEEETAKFIKNYLKPTLTEDERVILRNIDTKYKYIGRNGKPSHIYLNDFQYYSDIKGYYPSPFFDHLFQFIKERRRIRDSRTIKGVIKRMNYLKIMDYKNQVTETTIDLDKLEEILIIKIDIITGDEICTVIYKNGDIQKFDSSDDRLQDFYDGSYIIYNKEKGLNIIDKFVRRKNSYDYI